VGDVEGQRDDTESQEADAEASRAELKLAGLTQGQEEVPEGFSWGRLELRG